LLTRSKGKIFKKTLDVQDPQYYKVTRQGLLPKLANNDTILEVDF